MKKLFLLIAFVILTNHLDAQKLVYTFEPSSLRRVEFNGKRDCKHFDGRLEGRAASGVGCTTATLYFNRMTRRAPWTPGYELDLVFKDEAGKWQMTLRFTPAKCKPAYRGGKQAEGFVCAGVSWSSPD